MTKPSKPRKPRRTVKRTGPDDPLWKIIGLAKDKDGATDVSSNKYKYLAEAYADLHGGPQDNEDNPK
jgi:hypothetical protein